MTVQDIRSLIFLPDAPAPSIAEDAFIAHGSRIIGDVRLEAAASVWYNAVLRADNEPITIGEGSNIQDGVAVHTDPGSPCTLGRNVSVGHNAVVHGATIGDNVLIGMGAVVLNGAVIGENTLVAGGAVVLEGAQIPAGSLVAGVPAKVRRELTAEEIEGITRNAETYRVLSARHSLAD